MFARVCLTLGLLLGSLQLQAADTVYRFTVEKPMDEAYQAVYQSLEENRFFVIFEANIGRSLSGMAERFGEDYNRNGLESVRAMAFCNPWYANQVSNLDTEMMALCPLRLSVIHKAGKTDVLFVRPSQVGKGSPAEKLLTELENDVIQAIEAAFK